jgi:hypothetical protein
VTLASDFAHMLENAPGRSTVTYNGVTSFGVLNRSSEWLPAGDGSTMVQAKLRTLTIQRGVFTNLRVDGRIIIDGVPYIIGECDDEGVDDGQQIDLLVKRAP